MNHRKQSRRQLWPGFSCSLCWWCSQRYYTRVRLSAGSLYTKKILQMYSMLSNPLSKLKGSPSAAPRFLMGSSLTCFLSLPASLFLLFPSVKLTFVTGLWQWQRLSCPGSGPAVRFTVGLFYFIGVVSENVLQTASQPSQDTRLSLETEQKRSRRWYTEVNMKTDPVKKKKIHVSGLILNESWVCVILVRKSVCNLKYINN